MSHLFSTLSTLRPPPASSPLIIGLTTATATGILAFFALRSPAIPLPSVIPSPRELLGDLTDKEKDYLPYPPDVLLDGRWVDTPYGVIRVYEFGPTKGKKVVFVHGNSTPCPVARDLLWDLVGRGCRVLTFDLYGRGYSDTPLTPHDHRLFSSQIIFALSSSGLHWTNFTLIGYSLGGGISVSFTSHFSHMIDELILLAPSGILKKSRLSLLRRMVHSGWIPNTLATLLVGRQLNVRQTQNYSRRVASDPMDRAVVLDVPSIAEWQSREHRGFLYSYTSSFKCGPMYNRQEEWAIVGEYLREAGKRILILLAKNDTDIDPALLPEMLELLRGGEHEGREPERVVGIVVDGAHDFVRMKGRMLAGHIEEFWKDSRSMDWVY
ncbi:Alpha/Beta hydrolase protein [Tuber borchii]|uniref:Alpha/Beta hydrolase protein n=1 Tax=Tuber borchii TaxID=42251 RepID=A0A2T6ZHZ5_TUBBO|nr:Alpha/Beta hydrolase protein [Tuber borchii]